MKLVFALGSHCATSSTSATHKFQTNLHTMQQNNKHDKDVSQRCEGLFTGASYSKVARNGGCRVGEVRASTTSFMPDHKGFKPQ